MHQVRQWLWPRRSTAPEYPCPRKTAATVQIQNEGPPPDSTGCLFYTGASLRIQITEKDQRKVEIFRMRLAAPMIRQFLLNPSQHHPLPFIGPQRKE